MQSVFAFAMTAMLFVHTALGCCWHYGHACGQGVTNGRGPVHSEACCEHQHHEHQSPGPCDCQYECQGSHRAIRSQKVEVIRFDAVAPLDIVGLPRYVTSAPVGPAGCWQAATKLDGSHVPLRTTHLLHQVLLI